MKLAGASKYLVLTFPGKLVFTPIHLKAAQGRFCIAYLYGHPKHCLRAFLEREHATGRNLGQDLWDQENYRTFAALSFAHNHPLLIDAFNLEGLRRSPEQILDEQMKLLEKS